MTNVGKPLPQVLEDVKLLAGWLTQELKIDPTIAQIKMLDTISGLYPEYGLMLTSAKQEVVHSAPLENVDLTPTQIANKLTEQTGRKISSREVNQALEELGLQKKETTSGDNWQWQLTEKGKKYGRAYLATSPHNNWSGNQVKWREETIDLLKQKLV